MSRIVACFALAFIATGCASLPYTPVVIPWHVGEATHRQIVEVRSPIPRTSPVVDLELNAREGDLLRLIDLNQPEIPLPVFRSGRRVSVRLPEAMDPIHRIAVYWTRTALSAPSPLLDARPFSGDDYATTTHNDTWDFDEGDQDGIRSWGDRPHHYGPITVKGGVLNVPVTGNDPYCIWGVMFGNLDDQPPGHTGSPAESIDTALYSVLRMRLRQSCPEATWTVFFTDKKGRYQKTEFEVKGTAFQTLELNLTDLFPNFWDGRTMRAFRLDTTNDQVGATVEIDWVRIERGIPDITLGPPLSRDAIRQRDPAASFQASCPPTATAGTEAEFVIRDAKGKDDATPSPNPPFTCELRTLEGEVVAAVNDTVRARTDGQNVLRLSVGTRAQPLVWTIGPTDDMGRPATPFRTGRISVVPAGFDHYRLIPETRVVPTDGARRVRIAVTGSDRFGNDRPVRAMVLSVATDNGGRANVQKGRDGGCVISLDCSDIPLTTHTVVLADESGVTGTCTVRTIGFRKSAVAISRNGYLTIDGTSFLPLGGFYANWPSGLPDAEGRLSRSVDLFPCNTKPYPHGHPWPEDVESKVNDYLDLCRKHGVTTLRLMLRNMDIVGRVDPVQLQATLHLFDLARERDIRFDVALFEDYGKPPYCNADIIDTIALPHYTPDDLANLPDHRARFLVRKDILASPAGRYRDPDAIRCQKEYLDELIPVLAGREEVFCYEFENEMVRPPMSWCRDIAAHIRTIDPHTPVLGNPGPHDWPEPWRWRDSTCDLFCYHPYNNGMPTTDHGAVMYARSKWAAASGIPFFTGEGGINQNRWQKGIAKVSPAASMRGIRDQIWLSMMCGANGALMWTAGVDAEMAEFGKVSPALNAVGVDLLSLERRRPATVVVMPDDASANRTAYALAYQLLSRGIDFDTRPATDSTEYAVRLDPAKTEVPEDLTAEFFVPGNGWQAAALVSKSADQAIVYLRNVAGGLEDRGGKKRPCWVRTPQAVVPSVRLLNGRWGQIRAFDLDQATSVAITRNGNVISGTAATDHDLVLGFRR